MVKIVYLLGAIALLACSLAVASFVNPNSIEGTPQLGVPYEISWEPVISSATSKIKNVRLQLGDGDGITAVNVLFDIATLPFPATTSYTYTWPANLTTTNTNYTVVLQGLDAKDIVLETEYIIWFQLSAAAAPPQIPPQTPPQTPSQSAESQTATGLGTPTQKSAPGRVAATSYGVQDNTLSTGTFFLAVFTIAATVTF